MGRALDFQISFFLCVICIFTNISLIRSGEVRARGAIDNIALLSGELLKFSFVRLNTEWLIASCGFTFRPNSGHVKENSVFTSRCRLRSRRRTFVTALHYAYLASALWRNRLMMPAKCVVTFLVAVRKIWMLLSEHAEIYATPKSGCKNFVSWCVSWKVPSHVEHTIIRRSICICISK